MTILETEFKKHVNDFMMIQSMNDANSMQHEEARRMAMKAVKSRLDEMSRKFRFVLLTSLAAYYTLNQGPDGNRQRAGMGRARAPGVTGKELTGRLITQAWRGCGGHLRQ